MLAERLRSTGLHSHLVVDAEVPAVGHEGRTGGVVVDGIGVERRTTCNAAQEGCALVRVGHQTTGRSRSYRCKSKQKSSDFFHS